MKTREQNRNKNERKYSDSIGLSNGHNIPQKCVFDVDSHIHRIWQGQTGQAVSNGHVEF